MSPETRLRDAPSDALEALRQSVQATQSIIDRLPAFRTSLLRRLLRQGMGHTAFPTGPLGRIPASWEVRSVGDLASLTSGKAKPGDSSHLQSPSRSVPVYGGSGLLGFTRNALRAGSTIVVGRIGVHCGAVRFIADEASWITDNALFVYETRPEIDLRFLYYSLLYLDLRSLRNEGRQPLISLAAIYPALIAVPPLPEQRDIAAILLSVDALAEVQGRVLDQSKRLQSALASPGTPSAFQ